MKTKNLTPFPFGTKVTARLPPQREMTMVLRGKFTLAPGEPVVPLEGTGFPQGFLTADLFHEEDEERLGECLYASDFADFKLHADLLFKGTCYPAGGRVAAECPVEVAVGAWSKRLRAIGRRVWTENMLGNAISAPAPFVKMPLGYDHAFGGPEHPWNVTGKGLDTPELPNVESFEDSIQSRGDRPQPVGFGPINPAWPQRSGKLGKEYGKKWKAERAPFYAEDFDWTYFNAAPLDQQLQGYLRGDEEIRFSHLHPTASTFKARLPGLRIRAFVKDVEGAFREVRMNLDTLFADLDEGTLTLTWRGLDKVRDPDLKDIAFVLIASENLAEPPLPKAHYQMVLADFEADPMGVKDFLPPEYAEFGDLFNQQLKDYEAGKPPPVPSRNGPQPAAPGGSPSSLDPVSARLQQKLGGAAPGTQDQVRRSMGSLDNVNKLAADAKPGTDIKGMIAKGVQDSDGPSRIAPVAAVGAMPRIQLQDTVARMKAAAATLRKIATERNLEIANLDKLEAAANDPRLAQLDPSLAGPQRPAGEAPPEPGPEADLQGRDLSGQDLSGRDLHGANLEGAILTGANLSGANLAGACLKQATLVEANLERASFAGADLTMANLSEVKAAGAVFDRATLDQASLLAAHLEGASFEGAKAEQGIFASANFRKAWGRGCRFEQCDFEGAILEDADFRGATLVRCLLARIDGTRVDLEQAVLTKSSFSLARLEKARFVQCSGDLTFWAGATLDGADFSYATLPRAHFTEASLRSVSFFAADLKESRFYRATLDQAGLVRCNLFGADFCRAVMNGTRFTDSSLYDAKFLDAGGKGCDFTGANLKASTLENA